MKMKKIVVLLLTVIMTMGMMTGCGTGSTDSGNSADTSSVQKTDSGSASEDQNGKKSDNGKVLVVYYSATGSTKAVAQTIANTTGGTLFEIQPKEPYTDEDLNWTNDDSRVSREHEDESLRNVELVTTKVDDWDSYDTVFIGYTIWWAIAAWPVDNFVKANDFSGKTVIPFCTSASSGIGDSGNLLADMAGNGNWQDGERFSSGASESEVSDWVKELGYAK